MIRNQQRSRRPIRASVRRHLASPPIFRSPLRATRPLCLRLHPRYACWLWGRSSLCRTHTGSRSASATRQSSRIGGLSSTTFPAQWCRGKSRIVRHTCHQNKIVLRQSLLGGTGRASIQTIHLAGCMFSLYATLSRPSRTIAVRIHEQVRAHQKVCSHLDPSMHMATPSS